MTAPFLLDEMSEESACLAGRSTYDREMSDDSHVSRAVALAQAGLVLGEDDVEHPVSGAILA